MTRISFGLILTIAVGLAVWGVRTFSAQDKYNLQVPNGLAFSELRGYEDWQTVAVSQTEASNALRVILANPVMMKAQREGIPGNGKLFPDGAKMAKIVWRQRKITTAPFSVSTPDRVPDALEDVEFMEKDSKRFADSGGWGWAVFEYEAASGMWRGAHFPVEGNSAPA